MLTVYAPAKLNLVLEVLGKYSNEYHQVFSIMQTINLCDILNFEPAREISFNCDEPGLKHDNLVIQATKLLKEVTKYSGGVRIELYKRIPWGTGLGGGSSDAAATLVALNKLWALSLSASNLAYLASRLGSDVPFFVFGGTALVEGMGEKVTPLPPMPPAYFVLLVPPLPPIPGKTKRLYTKLSDSHFTKGQFVHAVLPSLMENKIPAPATMFNAFEKVVFDVFPKLEEYKKAFEQAGATNIHLAGSGPALFTLVYKKKEAKELCLHLQRQGLRSYVASSILTNG